MEGIISTGNNSMHERIIAADKLPPPEILKKYEEIMPDQSKNS